MIALYGTLGFGFTGVKAQDWPKIITASDGSVIKIYEPQPESFSGNVLKSRAAVSVQDANSTDPHFGTFWAIETVETDRDNRKLTVISAKVPNLKMATGVDDNRINYIKTALETQIPALNIELPLDEVLTSIDMNTEQKKLSKDLNNNAPKIYYSSTPSILVVIDGTPKLQRNSDWGLDAVVNSPFTIVKNNDGQFYLYGGKHWYSAPAATGPYSYVTNIPSNLNKVQTAVDNANTTDAGYTTDDQAAAQNTSVSNIIVSTQPAELIQSKGTPSFTSVDGTSLSYVSNSDNDIFRDQNGQYYVLLSGRWYQSSNLSAGNWQYVAATALPADFAKIPEGSAKDNVLASVAGTDAARDAVMDAQIPQTAKVDRKTATANVTYDGNPQFNNIDGTSMQYATNTQSSVIRYQNNYYCVENGVWFVSANANGPWSVCTNRPDEVDIIPPSSPVYNLKYVYIYDVTPDWVYMGYTPGYLNAYIYGPTVVYGTGFNYAPWYGSYYYPRPYTWGFGVRYNPWIGWSFGFNYSYGWFNCGWGGGGYYGGGWGGWHGGWWGPTVYRPPYRPYAWGGGGYYGRNSVVNRVTVNNVRVTNNIYNNRRDVITRNNANRPYSANPGVGRPGMNNGNVGGANRPNQVTPGGGGSRPGMNNGGVAGNRGTNQAGVGQQQTRPSVTTDRQGNVYQRNNQPGSNNVQWQQRTQQQWQPVNNNAQVQNLNRQQQSYDRGQQRTQNFQAARGNSAPQMSRPSGGGGGGGRPSGGGGGSRGGRH